MFLDSAEARNVSGGRLGFVCWVRFGTSGCAAGHRSRAWAVAETLAEQDGKFRLLSERQEIPHRVRDDVDGADCQGFQVKPGMTVEVWDDVRIQDDVEGVRDEEERLD